LPAHFLYGEVAAAQALTFGEEGIAGKAFDGELFVLVAELFP